MACYYDTLQEIGRAVLLSRLTAREREVLRLRLKGQCRAIIAQQIGVSRDYDVELMLNNIRAKAKQLINEYSTKEFLLDFDETGISMTSPSTDDYKTMFAAIISQVDIVTKAQQKLLKWGQELSDDIRKHPEYRKMVHRKEVRNLNMILGEIDDLIRAVVDAACDQGYFLPTSIEQPDKYAKYKSTFKMLFTRLKNCKVSTGFTIVYEILNS